MLRGDVVSATASAAADSGPKFQPPFLRLASPVQRERAGFFTHAWGPWLIHKRIWRGVLVHRPVVNLRKGG